MSDNQMILLPKQNYYEWVAAARDYVLKFGCNLTPDPQNATMVEVVTIANAPNAYGRDIVQWYKNTFPQMRLDVLEVATPAELKSALAQRIAKNEPYPPVATPPATTPPVPTPPPAPKFDWSYGKCLVGVNGRADGPMQEADFQAVAAAKLEAVKLLSTARPEDVDRLRQIRSDMFIMVRLFASFKDRKVRSDEFASWVEYDMKNFYDRGVRYFELHNEPNMFVEGQGASWQNGREFGAWLIDVRNRLKPKFPEAKFGYPGLSPGSANQDRVDSWAFLSESDAAARLCDWIGCHCYFIDDAAMVNPGGGLVYEEFRKRYPDKVLFITEFSNPKDGVSVDIKARQYVNYYQRLRTLPGMGAAFSFVVSASMYFPYEAWRDEQGRLTAIPAVVGAREF